MSGRAVGRPIQRVDHTPELTIENPTPKATNGGQPPYASLCPVLLFVEPEIVLLGC